MSLGLALLLIGLVLAVVGYGTLGIVLIVVGAVLLLAPAVR